MGSRSQELNCVIEHINRTVANRLICTYVGTSLEYL